MPSRLIVVCLASVSNQAPSQNLKYRTASFSKFKRFSANRQYHGQLCIKLPIICFTHYFNCTIALPTTFFLYSLLHLTQWYSILVLSRDHFDFLLQRGQDLKEIIISVHFFTGARFQLKSVLYAEPSLHPFHIQQHTKR